MQVPLDRGLGAAGVAIDPRPIKGVLNLPPSSIKSTFPALKNPANDHRAVMLTADEFQWAFTNTMTDAQSRCGFRLRAPGPRGRPDPLSVRARAHPHRVHTLAATVVRSILRRMANITFLGTGLMGAALAEAAAKRGDRVTAWNRSATKAKALEPFGVRAVETVAAAVTGAERVHVILADDAAVDSVLDAAGDGLRGAIVVDHSTTSPAGTAERAKRLDARGVAFLHAPVFMTPKMCREATGMMFVAGAQTLRTRASKAPFAR